MGYEATPSIDSLADAEIENNKTTRVPDERRRSYEGVQNMDLESTADDHGRFVVVQKKKKVRQPVLQLPQQYAVSRRPPYDTVASLQAVHSHTAPRVSAGCDTCKTDEVVLLTSDTDSTSSYPHDNSSATASIRCSSPDFPDLVVQACAVAGRRNSTGSVCKNVAVNDSLPLPPSYAIVAAGGMRSNPAVDVEWRRSFDAPSVTNVHSHAEQRGLCSSSVQQDSFSQSLMSVEDKSRSKLLLEDVDDMPSRTHIDSETSEPSTPTGYCSADSRSIVSDDLAKELSSIRFEKAASRLQTDGATAVAISTSDYVASLVDRKVALHCDQRTKLSQSPVVFLDIANERRPVRNDLGVSFGFDSSDSLCTIAQSECSSSESGFSDCTVHTDADKTSWVASTDTATSPIDRQDFTPTETVPSGVTQSVTVGHCRPIVPFQQSCSHTPVGIVPPIPQVDRPAEPVEQDLGKDSKHEIMSSVISCDLQKDDILHRELVHSGKQFPHDKSTVSSRSTAFSVPAGSFNLLTAQIFLYTG